MSETEKIPTKRNGYYYLDNNRVYPSVTKILQDVLHKPALLYWYGYEASRIALAEPTLNDKEVMAQLQLKVKEAQQRGKWLHSYMEKLATDTANKMKTYKAPKEYRGYVKALNNWFDVYKPHGNDVEVIVYSDLYKFAGRVDYVCTINSTKGIVDFKTGKNLYREVGLQLVAYKQAYRESHYIEVEKTWAVLLQDSGEFMMKETNDNIYDFAHVLAIYSWLKRKE